MAKVSELSWTREHFELLAVLEPSRLSLARGGPRARGGARARLLDRKSGHRAEDARRFERGRRPRLLRLLRRHQARFSGPPRASRDSSPSRSSRKSSELRAPGWDANQVLPLMVKRLVPPGALGILMGAFIAGVMTNLESYVNSASTLLVTDLYRPFLRPNATDDECLRSAASSWSRTSPRRRALQLSGQDRASRRSSRPFKRSSRSSRERSSRSSCSACSRGERRPKAGSQGCWSASRPRPL